MLVRSPTVVTDRRARGVSLLGIDSVQCPLTTRTAAWTRLESGLERGKMAKMTAEIGLGQVIETTPRILAGQVRGRIVVKIG